MPLAVDALASFEAVVIDRIDCGEEIVHFAQLASYCKGTAEASGMAFHGQHLPSRAWWRGPHFSGALGAQYCCLYSAPRAAVYFLPGIHAS